MESRNSKLRSGVNDVGYLILGCGEVLAGETTRQEPKVEDLALEISSESSSYKILKGSLQIAKQLDRLAREYGYRIVLHSKSAKGTSNVLKSLGNAWGSLGNYKAQLELTTQALEIKRRAYGRS